MRVGTLCYATDSGLGILAKSFVDNKIITHPYIVRHGHHHTHEEWYPGAPVTANLRADHAKILEFARGMDLMFFQETPFLWELLPFCKQHGVKTVLQPMYECEPKRLPYEPDLFLCPSLLDLQYFSRTPSAWVGMDLPGSMVFADPKYRSLYLPVPVEMPWKLRTKAEVFVHNAGHGGLKGRNGTAELLASFMHVKSKAEFLVRSQRRVLFDDDVEGRLKWQVDQTVPYDQLYSEGDVFIFPEKFNGLSLPLQEAYASGMLVMTSDRFPNNTYLPREPLIPVSQYETTNISPRCNDFQSAIIEPRAIAETIDRWYGRDISEFSLRGKKWAEKNSWAVLGPRYKKVLEDLCS